jgi:hypothetical protein
MAIWEKKLHNTDPTKYILTARSYLQHINRGKKLPKRAKRKTGNTIEVRQAPCEMGGRICKIDKYHHMHIFQEDTKSCDNTSNNFTLTETNFTNDTSSKCDNNYTSAEDTNIFENSTFDNYTESSVKKRSTDITTSETSDTSEYDTKKHSIDISTVDNSEPDIKKHSIDIITVDNSEPDIKKHSISECDEFSKTPEKFYHASTDHCDEKECDTTVDFHYEFYPSCLCNGKKEQCVDFNPCHCHKKKECDVISGDFNSFPCQHQNKNEQSIDFNPCHCHKKKECDVISGDFNYNSFPCQAQNKNEQSIDFNPYHCHKRKECDIISVDCHHDPFSCQCNKKEEDDIISVDCHHDPFSRQYNKEKECNSFHYEFLPSCQCNKNNNNTSISSVCQHHNICQNETNKVNPCNPKTNTVQLNFYKY